MKNERVIVKYNELKKPVLVATGVSGGGFVSIRLNHQYEGTFGFGGKDWLNNEAAYALLDKNKPNLLYLKEGEELYASSPSSSSDLSYYYFITYYNNEQFSTGNHQQAPINLTGTIQLNQQ